MESNCHYDPRAEVAVDQLISIGSAINGMSDAATAAISERPRGVTSFTKKDDGSRVTELDHRIEDLWRGIVCREFPSHSIIAEESGNDLKCNDYCWYLDPIDGTDDLTRGMPLFGFIIGVTYKGWPIAGAIGHPDLNIHVTGTFGKGVFANGSPVDFDKFVPESDPAIAFPAMDDFVRHSDMRDFSVQLSNQFPNHRIYRNVFAHTAVLLNGLQAAVEIDVAEWDVLATQFLVEEGGGRYVELGNHMDASGNRRVSSVFGRPTTVARVLEIHNQLLDRQRTERHSRFSG